MKKCFKPLLLVLLFVGTTALKAQDLRINHVNNVPDTSLFSNAFPANFYFQFTSGALASPFTVYFNYSVNGIVQALPLDSFTYLTAITSEQTKDIIIRTNAPVFRKGDNIVVVWPICYQATHSISYYRTHIFVTDSLNTSVQDVAQERSSNWNVIFNNEDHKLKITNAELTDFPFELHVFDNTGKMIVSEKMNREESMSMPQLPAAIYMYELESKGRKSSGKFLQY